MSASWIAAANGPEAEFPLHGLPYGVAGGRPVAAIGDRAVDLRAAEEAGLFGEGAPLFAEPHLNPFMAAGPEAWAHIRGRLTDLLREGGDPALRETPRALVPLSGLDLSMPFEVAEYTDFYSGRHHAFNAGRLIRGPDKAMPENWFHLPVGYNGRASTVVVSGTPVRRPRGQLRAEGGPVFGPSRRLDFELEIGAVVGTPSEMGRSVSVAEARAMIFGVVLLNDWSARDIQAWEYQPLGPFQGKAFASTISPWVVPAAALEPTLVPPPPREAPVLPYLAEDGPSVWDIALEAELTPAGGAPHVIARTNARELYWSAAQQLAHHASSGCAMRTGDLLGSGTVSGPERGEWGSLLEITEGGTQPLDLGGATRTWLEDGDTLVLRGRAGGVSFGICAGTVLPAEGGTT